MSFRDNKTHGLKTLQSLVNVRNGKSLFTVIIYTSNDAIAMHY